MQLLITTLDPHTDDLHDCHLLPCCFTCLQEAPPKTLFCWISQNSKMGLKPFQKWQAFNPTQCGREGRGGGGGGVKNNPPPTHMFVIPRRRKKNGNSLFFTFPKYENGRLGTNFCSQITFSVVRGG